MIILNHPQLANPRNRKLPHLCDCASWLLPVEEAYQLWAPEYDSAPNPLFCLEERHLAPLLPSAAHCDVVDLGSGTGRWLERLYPLQPRSLTGVDVSAAMLERAARKLGHNARLVQADCLHTPLGTNCADWILSSFLLSYVGDLHELAREAARIARSGALLVISDVHPATAKYGWKRTFRSAHKVVEIKTYPYQLHDLCAAMNETGFELESLNEYAFGEDEKTIFVHAGRPELYAAVKGLPVLFLASYRRRHE
ncbi:MAG: class I SAM-dependent methyltransferase [Terracidiphilus sp.]